MMTDRPMIFSAPMARALLDGRKTQTRRVLKPQPRKVNRIGVEWPDGYRDYEGTRIPYHPGDRIWVRETWAEGRDAPAPDGAIFPIYAANWGNRGSQGYELMKPWRSSMFMPRKYSRLTLIVTNVRVQRLHEISEEDAISEGVGPTLVSPDGGSAPHVETYIELWNSLNAKRGYPWASNPWVCALTFDVIRQNIDALSTGSAAGI